jgi:hypothetical protein
MRRAVGAAFPVVVSALALAFPTSAYGYGSTQTRSLALESALVDPCGSTSVTGTGFQPGETAAVVLDAASTTLSTITVGPTGSFTTSITIPQGTSPGNHTITSNGAQGDTSSTEITVGNGGCAVTAATIAASPGLAFTGADIATVTGVGGVLVALGGTLFIFGRRRRRSTSSSAVE